MRFAIVIFSTVLAVSSLAQTQSKPIHLQQSQVLNTKLGSNDWGLSETACDIKGNLFVTVWDPAEEDPSDRPLLMFDNAGALKTRFASSRKELQLSRFEDHYEPTALLSDGGVARLVWSQDSLSLAVFSADGKLTSRTAFDPPAIVPSQLAVFPSGEALVTGLEHSHSRRALGPYKSFTALYDKNGHVLKRFALPEDAEVDAAAEIGDSRYAQGSMFGNRAITSGQARLGNDGNVYLMRRKSPATVYVIASSGELVRTLKIEPAEPGQMPMGMQVAAGRIAVEFRCSASQCEGVHFTVADASTGEKLSEYTDEKAYEAFACYSTKPDRFTFLTVSDDKKLEVIQAAAK